MGFTHRGRFGFHNSSRLAANKRKHWDGEGDDKEEFHRMRRLIRPDDGNSGSVSDKVLFAVAVPMAQFGINGW